MTAFARVAEAAVEVAHHGLDGTLHGHTLMVRAWTRDLVDLDEWRQMVAGEAEHMEHGALEETVGRTFEDVAQRMLDRLPGAYRVTVGLPSRGHVIEAER